MAPVVGDLWVPEATSVVAPEIHEVRDVLARPATFELHARTAPAPSPTPSRNPNYIPGKGSLPPQKFNNKGLFGLFGLIGAVMVLAIIWFFFWAKNGGFRWRKGDWDDYKSTVLRRKGPDGKTLSNATKTTDLGQKSVAGTFDNYRDEMTEVKTYWEPSVAGDRPKDKKRKDAKGEKDERAKRKHKERIDDDLRAYRHEKSAKVGGLNRESDSSHMDFTNTDRSDLYSHSDVSRSDVGSDSSRKPLRPKAGEPSKEAEQTKKKGIIAKKLEENKGKRRETKDKKQRLKDFKAATEDSDRKRKKQSQRMSSPIDEVMTNADTASVADTYGGQGYAETAYTQYRPYEPSPLSHGASPSRQAGRHSYQQPAHQAGRSSPKRRTYPQPPSTYTGTFDAHSEAGTNDTGTKSYPHVIPELYRGSRDVGLRRGGGDE